MRSADKRNRGKRVLDFVRNAARHFAPRRLLLRAQQIGEVLEHHDVSHALAAAIAGGRRRRIERGHRHRYIQIYARGDDLHLAGGGSHAVGFAQHVLQIGRPRLPGNRSRRVCPESGESSSSRSKRRAAWLE